MQGARSIIESGVGWGGGGGVGGVHFLSRLYFLARFSHSHVHYKLCIRYSD